MRIGILGGTFNPIHSAHVQMAQYPGTKRRWIWCCSWLRPIRRISVWMAKSLRMVRLEMVRLAAQTEARVEPSDLEIKRGGKSYTLDTLLELQKRYPGAELFLVLGSDTLGDLPNWHKPEEVLKIASVLCVPRIGLCENDEKTAEELSARYGAKIRLLTGKADRISSTEVRDRLEEGLDTTGLLPDAVEQTCYENGVYFRRKIQQMQQNSARR
jgi:nicotinate-nucleotide adenylyltransferase